MVRKLLLVFTFFLLFINASAQTVLDGFIQSGELHGAFDEVHDSRHWGINIITGPATIGSVELSIKWSQAAVMPPDLVVALHTDSGSVPSETILGSAIVPAASISSTNFAFATATFASPVVVGPGPHWIVLSAPTAPDDEGYRLEFYRRGTFGHVSFTADSGTTWTLDTKGNDIEHRVLAPPEPKDIIALVEELVASKAINQGRGTALTQQLQAAQQQFEGGNTAATAGMLNGFIALVNSISTLTPAEAQSLIDAASAITP